MKRPLPLTFVLAVPPLFDAACALPPPAGGAAAAAQVRQGRPDQRPELRALDYFQGEWVIQVDDTIAAKRQCAWTAGDSLMLCRIQWKSPEGDLKGLGILGYNAGDKLYRYVQITGAGRDETFKGTLDRATWTWQGDAITREGKPVKIRTTFTKVSPTSYTIQSERSAEGAPMSPFLKANATKVVAPEARPPTAFYLLAPDARAHR